jgi:hypothetical protein
MDELAIDKRLELHNILVNLISSERVYFQPPSSIKLIYPCIIYELDSINVTYADSIKYKNKKRYTITVIDQNPDSEIPNNILMLNYCSFDRHFISDNLNHYVFTLYY